jgi:hypothetical protein
MTKKNLYVIVLLLLILFVSLSFYYILNFNKILREGLCLPNCDKTGINTTTGEIPKCTPVKLDFLKSSDATKIYSKCITPFIKSINEEMKQNYKYDVIQTLYNENIYITNQGPANQKQGSVGNQGALIPNENQIKINSYFTDFSNNITLQDKMDNLVSKMSEIQNNQMFNKHPKKTEILESLQKYEKERKDKFLEIYKKLVEKIEPYGQNILIQDDCEKDENQRFYKDENFNQLIKDQKENILCYGQKSTFHILEDYLREGIQGKLGEI